MRNLLMYAHNGAANHGCEALVLSTLEAFHAKRFDKKILMSHRPEEDRKFALDEFVELHSDHEALDKTFFSFARAYYDLKINKNIYAMDKFCFGGAIKKAGRNAISLSIGGDNFCYEELYKFMEYHKYSKELGQTTVLWGCSVDESVFSNEKVVKDFKDYDLVVARESLTYELMQKHGVTNLVFMPDPAFILPTAQSAPIKLDKPTIGINLSPLVMDYSKNSAIVFDNCLYLIDKILGETEYDVALIPHVTWKFSNDYEVLKKIKTQYANEYRIILIDELDARTMKAVISQMKFLVTARTHASIAAYSTGVPTLVLGYSIKSLGIAKDLFGTYENYVVPVSKITKINQLWNSFKWILEHEIEIKQKLNNKTKDYKVLIADTVDSICKL